MQKMQEPYADQRSVAVQLIQRAVVCGLSEARWSQAGGLFLWCVPPAVFGLTQNVTVSPIEVPAMFIGRANISEARGANGAIEVGVAQPSHGVSEHQPNVARGRNGVALAPSGDGACSRAPNTGKPDTALRRQPAVYLVIRLEHEQRRSRPLQRARFSSRL